VKVTLMIPCYIDAFYPQVGIATLEQLERLGVSTALDVLPHFAIYNRLNASGRSRGLPQRRFMSETRIISSKGMRCSGYE